MWSGEWSSCSGEARKTRFAVSEWSTHCMAHGRSRSGNVLVPLASVGARVFFWPGAQTAEL